MNDQTKNSRDILARAALARIPKILTLLNRNRHSPTYGCFDRNFWHYRIIDFPSGMAQEFVYPLALAWDLDMPGNPYHKRAAVREWVEAGIRFAATSAHADGSSDDYFPFERAGGATGFALFACIEAAKIIGLRDSEIDTFIIKRADWLSHLDESGKLANHQALIALSLATADKFLALDRWKKARERYVARTLSWQNEEGWYQEYEGCDPGYQTLTISFLARLHEMDPSPLLEESLEKAIAFVAHFIHPDGSFGGELGSRNTYSFFPHGFELAGRWMPKAPAITDKWLDGMAAGLDTCFDDDHIIGHHTWNYFLAWRDYQTDRHGGTLPGNGRTWFKEAGLLVDRREETALYLALNKGGAFKLFRQGRLVASDTQFSVLAKSGRNAVGHLIDDYDILVGNDEITVRGTLGWAKHKQMRPYELILFRVFMMVLGRFFPNLVRKFLQGIMITGKNTAPFRFERKFLWRNGAWEVKDGLTAERWSDVRAVGLGCDQTSIYVAMSRTYQAGQMRDWVDLSGDLKNLRPGGTLTLSRRFDERHKTIT